MGWFRAHQVLKCFNIHILDVVGNFFILLQSFAVFFVSIPIYLLIKTDEDPNNFLLKVFAGFLVVTNINMLIVCSNKAKDFYEKSHRIYLYWKTSNDPKWNVRNDKLFKRYLKSFSPLKIKLGSLFFFDRGLVVNNLRATFDFTIDLLLTNPLNLLWAHETWIGIENLKKNWVHVPSRTQVKDRQWHIGGAKCWPSTRSSQPASVLSHHF